jgi:hypothetical protein
MKHQFYPMSHRALADQVKRELGLPVDCPTRLQDSTLARSLIGTKVKCGVCAPAPRPHVFILVSRKSFIFNGLGYAFCELPSEFTEVCVLSCPEAPACVTDDPL